MNPSDGVARPRLVAYVCSFSRYDSGWEGDCAALRLLAPSLAAHGHMSAWAHMVQMVQSYAAPWMSGSM